MSTSRNTMRLATYRTRLGVSEFLIVAVLVIRLFVMFDGNLFESFNNIFVVMTIIAVLWIALLIRKHIYIRQMSMIACMICYFLFSRTITSANNLMNILSVIYMVTIVIALYNCEFTEKSLELLMFVVMSVNLLWIIINSNGYYDTWQAHRDLLNPNFAAEMVLFSYMFYSTYRKGIRGNIQKNNVVLFLATMISAWALWQCKSRNAIIGFLFFLLVSYVLPIKIWNKGRVMLVTTMIMLLGMLFPVLYIAMWQNKALKSSADEVIDKRLFTGREAIWNSFFKEFDSNLFNWLFGETEKVDVLSYAHNSYIQYVYIFGIIGLLFFMIFVLVNVNNIMKMGGGVCWNSK